MEKYIMVRQKILMVERGMKFGHPSEEHKRKIGLANAGEKSVNYGKKFSLETRLKMSVSMSGKKKPQRTEKHKKNISLSIGGNKHYRYDTNIHIFYHPEFGIEKCNRHHFISKYKLNKRCVGMIIEKKRKSYKQWRIYEP